MRNRDLMVTKLEHLDAQMNVLRTKVNGSYPVQQFIDHLEKSKELISEIRTIIDREPRTSNELNPNL